MCITKHGDFLNSAVCTEAFGQKVRMVLKNDRMQSIKGRGDVNSAL